MIDKNATYGKTKDVTVCTMGTGDVHMIGSEKDENGNVHLAMKTIKEPQPINVIVDAKVKSYDEFKPELAFIFSKVESIDCFINMLEDCKKEMLREGDKQPDK